MVDRSSTVRVTAYRRTEKSHSKSKMFQKAALSHPGWITKGSDLRKQTEPSSPMHHIASMSTPLATDGFWHSFCLEWYLYMLRVNLCPEAVSVVFSGLSGDDSRSGEGDWCQLTPLSASNRKCDLYSSSLKNNLAIVSLTLLSLCPSQGGGCKKYLTMNIFPSFLSANT